MNVAVYEYTHIYCANGNCVSAAERGRREAATSQKSEEFFRVEREGIGRNTDGLSDVIDELDIQHFFWYSTYQDDEQSLVLTPITNSKENHDE